MAIIKINKTITQTNGFAQSTVGRLFRRIEQNNFGPHLYYHEKMDGRDCEMVEVECFGAHFDALINACIEAKAAYKRPQDSNWTWILNREVHPTQADLSKRHEQQRLAEKEAERRLIEQKKMQEQARTAAAAKAMADELAAKEASKKADALVKKMKEAAFGSKPSKKDRRDAKVGSNTSPKSNRAKLNSAPSN